MSGTSLRRIIKETTGQDVYKCQGCYDCEAPKASDADIPLGSLVQMAIYDDKEALTCRTLWSDEILRSSRYSCHRGLNVQAIMLALREEAKRQGLK
jgi:hypothetical protein